MNYQTEIDALKAKIAELETAMRNQDEPIEAIKQVKADFDWETEWEKGDIIRSTLLTGERIEAQCQLVDEDGAIFCLTHCLDEERPMNEENTNEGGWDESDLRNYLNTKILEEFPKALLNRMKPIYEDDLLTLPSIEDIYGERDFDSWKPKEGAEPNWPLMKYRQYRCKGNWWWVRSAYYGYATTFCLVGTGGDANFSRASYSNGLAPAFRI